MSKILPKNGNEGSGTKSPSHTDTVGNNQNIDNNEKIANLEDSSRVRVMNENGRDLIDIDIGHLDEGKFYRIVYQGDAYGLEKKSNGQLAFYEVID